MSNRAFSVGAESGVTFTLPIEQRETYEREPVTFLCRLSKPGAVRWFAGDREVRAEEAEAAGVLLEARDGGLEHTLTVPAPTLEHAASYTVKCGDEESSARLIVHGTRFCDRNFTYVFSGDRRKDRMNWLVYCQSALKCRLVFV